MPSAKSATLKVTHRRSGGALLKSPPSKVAELKSRSWPYCCRGAEVAGDVLLMVSRWLGAGLPRLLVAVRGQRTCDGDRVE